MRARSLLELALRGLALHKLRSTLSALGIVFGVGAVVAMLSVGEGARREILAEVGRFGITRVSVRAGSLSEATESDADDLQSPGLTLADAEAIERICPNVVGLASLRESAERIRSRGRDFEAAIVATTPAYARTEEILLAAGRFLTDTDVADAKRVIVLGHEAAEALFPYANPLGSRVRIRDEWFAVVGTLEPREQPRQGARLSGRNLNRAAFVPLTSSPDPANRVDEITVRIDDAEAVRDAARVIQAIVTRRHRGAQDFEMVVPQELIAGYERARFQFNVVVGAVAAISLVVGGIGIMNIMLASVTERVREIGVRRSLGASRADIVRQFLAEALLLTGTGGVAGIALGALASQIVSSYAGWPTAMSLRAVLVAVGLAALTGVGFGLYPAAEAAYQNPVEALRRE